MTLPVLYSFRRCPYAMRARMALLNSGQRVELREVILRDKPAEMIELSPKATVPVLVQPDGIVLEESLDIMLWALDGNDPDGWLDPETGNRTEMLALIEKMDGPFKSHLDRYKYANRHATDGADAASIAMKNRDAAMVILLELDARLQEHRFLFGKRLSLADVAIAPFVRQFANTDAEWFAAQSCLPLKQWLEDFLKSHLFGAVMDKYDQWQSGGPGVLFPSQMEV